MTIRSSKNKATEVNFSRCLMISKFWIVRILTANKLLTINPKKDSIQMKMTSNTKVKNQTNLTTTNQRIFSLQKGPLNDVGTSEKY